MAIPAHGTYGTLDRTSYQYEDDYSDVWEKMAEPANRLVMLDMVKEGRPLLNPTYYWMEDLTKVRTVNLDGDIADDASTMDVSTGEHVYLQNGDMLVSTASGKREVIQVDDALADETITIIRGIGDTSGEAHTDGEVFRIVRSRPEGSEADDPEYKGTVRRTNYTGIISHTIKLTDSMMQGKPRGYAQAELDRQEAEILMSLKGELEDLILYGPGEARASDAHGQMRGICQEIIARAGSNYVTDAAVWSYELVDTSLNWLAQQGFMSERANPVLFVPATMCSAAGYWGASAVTRERSERTYGFEINMFHSTLGMDVPMIWGYSAKPGEFLIVDLNRFEMNPLGNRKLKRWLQPAGVNLQDYERRRLIMEWGCKLRYADKAHYLHTNVTVP